MHMTITLYAIHTLKKAAKYLQAASIFLNHHANKAKILNILTHDLYMPRAQKWLEHKDKIYLIN